MSSPFLSSLNPRSSNPPFLHVRHFFREKIIPTPKPEIAQTNQPFYHFCHPFEVISSKTCMDRTAALLISLAPIGQKNKNHREKRVGSCPPHNLYIHKFDVIILATFQLPSKMISAQNCCIWIIFHRGQL